MKHGRKEQFSITISMDVADDFYEYVQNNNNLFKNAAFEQLLRKAFLFIKFQEKYEENKAKIFKRGFGLAADLAIKYSKHKALLRDIKLHYSTLDELLLDFCQQTDIP